MIKNADKSMLPQLIKLWEICFEDGEEYSSFFFSHKMIGTDKFENQLVYMVEGEVASMLSVLPAKIIQKSGLQKFWYIYGVATDTKYRNRGYAGKLMEYVLQLASKENVVVGLVPASEGLYGYYGRFGFQTYFYKGRIQGIVSEEENSMDYKIIPIRANEYYSLRSESFNVVGTVVWDLEAVEYALAENQNIGGDAVKVIVDQKEYFALYYSYEGELQIRETNLPKDILMEVADEIAKRNQCKKFVASTSISNRMDMQNISRHGMIYQGGVLGGSGYLGLALD